MTIKDVHDKVRAEKTLIASVVALLVGLKNQVQNSLSGKLSDADQAEVDQIFAEADANREQLASALLDNTVPAPANVPAPAQASGTATVTADASGGSSTVTSDAVAQAAAKAGTALGELQEAVNAGEDHSDALSDLQTAHAELAGVNDNDTKAAEQKVAAAADALENADPGSDAAKTALQDLTAAHTDLVAAASVNGGPDGQKKEGEES